MGEKSTLVDFFSIEFRNSYFYIEKWTFKVMCEVYYRAKRDKKEATSRFVYFDHQIKFCGWAYEMNFCIWNFMPISKNREKSCSMYNRSSNHLIKIRTL